MKKKICMFAPGMNPSRNSSASAKLKKQSKVKSKSQPHSSSQSTSQHDGTASEKDKGSPSKDYQDYAGIGADSICNFAEQNSYEELSNEICNVLSEDINYKLRYIIHNAIVKTKIQRRDIITSEDIDEIFSNLKIDKVYGAPTNPNWLAFPDNSLYFLDDQKVNLVDLAEEECTCTQEGDVIINQVWLPDGNDSEDDLEEYSEQFTQYFQTVCEVIVSNDEDLRYKALKDISVNPSIGPVTDWFYNFSYFLLMKEATYDALTLKALELLEVLENSPLPSLHIGGKQLKLLIRLILQRLLGCQIGNNIIRPMCYVLSLFCLRPPLKRIVLNKVKSKVIYQETKLPLLLIIYYLGIDAVREVFMPHLSYFLTEDLKDDQTSLTEVILGIYSLICKSGINRDFYFKFYDIFGNTLVPFFMPKKITQREKLKNSFVIVNRKLLRTRRKFKYKKPLTKKHELEEVFEIPLHHCPIRQKIDIHTNSLTTNIRKETHITIGKANLLLSVLKSRRHYCIDHSIIGYN